MTAKRNYDEVFRAMVHDGECRGALVSLRVAIIHDQGGLKTPQWGVILHLRIPGTISGECPECPDPLPCQVVLKPWIRT